MPENEITHVSVIVPCRNEAACIRAFLDSVLDQDLGEIAMEILVAEGRSDDGTRSILREYEARYAAIRVIDNPEKIVSTGLNRAIRKSTGEIVIRMDAHTVYARNYVRSCVEVLRESRADNAGGPARTRACGYFAQAIAHAFHAPFASGGARFRNPDYEGPVDTVTYGCWRRATFERIGLFDEDLVRSQDDELNLRLAAAGGLIWQSPRIVSWYQPRTRLGPLFRQYFQYGFWKVAVIRKHPRRASWRNFVPGLALIVGIILPLTAEGANVTGSASWRNVFLGAWFGLAALYMVASFGSALWVARKKGWIFLPVLPVVFAAYQLSYALGFLLALFYRPSSAGRANLMQKALSTITR